MASAKVTAVIPLSVEHRAEGDTLNVAVVGDNVDEVGAKLQREATSMGISAEVVSLDQADEVTRQMFSGFGSGHWDASQGRREKKIYGRRGGAENLN